MQNTHIKYPTLNLNKQALVPHKNCLFVCAADCVHLWYTIQHWTRLIIFPFILQTITRA